MRSHRTADRICRRFALFGGVVGLLVLVSLVAASPAQASYDGRNGLVAFVADSGNGVQLYTVRPNGHGLRQITQLSGDAVAPDWSPDGRTIVFEHDLPGDEGAAVEVVNADGSDRSTLVQDPGVFSGAPSFTPDGSGIVSHARPRHEHRRHLEHGSRQPTQARNHRGKWVRRKRPRGLTGRAYPQLRRGNETDVGFGLYTCAMDGSGLRQLVPVSADLVDKQHWAPDGRRLAAPTITTTSRPGCRRTCSASDRTARTRPTSLISPAATSTP